MNLEKQCWQWYIYKIIAYMTLMKLSTEYKFIQNLCDLDCLLKVIQDQKGSFSNYVMLKEREDGSVRDRLWKGREGLSLSEMPTITIWA